MAKKILITGATGNIASLAIPQLLEKGAEVRAFVHNAGKAEKLEALGAEIIVGEFSEASKLQTAAAGTDAVISITPGNANSVAQAAAITDAAKKAGVKHLIRVSAVGAAPDAPTDNGRQHHKTDAAIIALGVPYTILRPNFYMQNLFMSVPTILREGKMYWGMGQGRIGMIDVRDVADCCVALALKGGHLNSIYTPTGPKSISFFDIAETLSDKLGKAVSYVPVPLAAVGDAIRGMGMGDWFAQVMTDYSRAYSEGWGDFVTGDVDAITGKKARGFEQFVDEVMLHALSQPVEA